MRKIKGHTVVQIEHENEDYVDCESYWTIAEFDVEFTMSEYRPKCWAHDAEGGELEDYTLTLTSFGRDGLSYTSFDDLSDFEKACLVEWAVNNLQAQIRDACERCDAEYDGPDPDDLRDRERDDRLMGFGRFDD